MNRKEFIKKSALFAAGAAFSPSLFANNDSERLVILHTNDWHSHIQPFAKDHKKYPGLGGAAKRASLIAEIRRKHKHVLLLDSGDIFQGTPYFNFYGGELEFKLMSEMGYDFATLGNHDFDNGIDGFKNQLQHADFKFLSANYDFGQTILKDDVDKYAIIRKGKFKIGVFGLGIELNGLVPKKLFGKTIYQNPIQKANETADYLKSQNCNLIICLSHLGFEYQTDKVSDVKLAKSTRNIDLILGGHTHTFLKAPFEISNQNGKNIFINQTGWAGINLGRIDYKADSPKSASIHGFDTKKII